MELEAINFNIACLGFETWMINMLYIAYAVQVAGIVC